MNGPVVLQDTVDAMAMAVENAELMLIGVSRQYKESSNCRMEAQYGNVSNQWGSLIPHLRVVVSADV